jgi:hypothetical protein
MRTLSKRAVCMLQHPPGWSPPGTGTKLAFLPVGLLVLLAAVVWAPPEQTPRLQAQEGPRLARLEIGIWPEFDRPAALVLLRGELAADVPLPATVPLHIPASSGGPSAVASAAEEGGNLVNTTYEVTEDEDSLLLTITAPDPFFHVEFYDPLATDSPEREYAYVWPGDLPVDQLSVRVQEPAGASGLSVEPDLGPGIIEADGLVYHSADLGSFEAGDTLDIQVSYRKTDPRTSLEILSAAAGTESDGGFPSWLVPAIVAALAALAVGGFIYWRSQRQPVPVRQEPGPGARRGGKAGRPSAQATGRQAFCTQCGHPLEAGDRFCSRCGTKVRAK